MNFFVIVEKIDRDSHRKSLLRVSEVVHVFMYAKPKNATYSKKLACHASVTACYTDEAGCKSHSTQMPPPPSLKGVCASVET